MIKVRYHAPPEVLAAADARRDGLGRNAAPHPDTVERIFTVLGVQALAYHTGANLAQRATCPTRSTCQLWRRRA